MKMVVKFNLQTAVLVLNKINYCRNRYVIILLQVASFSMALKRGATEV